MAKDTVVGVMELDLIDFLLPVYCLLRLNLLPGSLAYCQFGNEENNKKTFAVCSKYMMAMICNH